jgi:hypothetical protein
VTIFRCRMPTICSGLCSGLCLQLVVAPQETHRPRPNRSGRLHRDIEDRSARLPKHSRCMECFFACLRRARLWRRARHSAWLSPGRSAGEPSNARVAIADGGHGRMRPGLACRDSDRWSLLRWHALPSVVRTIDMYAHLDEVTLTSGDFLDQGSLIWILQEHQLHELRE